MFFSIYNRVIEVFLNILLENDIWIIVKGKKEMIMVNIDVFFIYLINFINWINVFCYYIILIFN